MAERTARLVYLGSYTPDSSGGGHGSGISVYRQDPETGALSEAGPVTPVSGPSFLAWHPTGRYLYAVNERPDGAVSAFAVATDGALRPLGSRPTGGADPCHLSVDATGRYLVTANYTSGSVSVHPIGTDGALGERCDLVQHHGSGPVTDRQQGPHCHQARFDAAGRYLLVNDLGTDQVHTYELVGGKLSARSVTDLEPGTGPRHLVCHDGRAFLAAELNSTVTTFDYRAERGTLTSVGRVDATGRHSDAPNYPSEILTSTDGRHVYVANRGANTVTTFDTTPEGLRPVCEVDCGGDWPRHLMLLGDHLYVANQNSDTVGICRLDPDTGRPTLLDTMPVPSPACLLPALS